MPTNEVKVPFPLKGKDENWAVSGQPSLTSPDLQNVRPRDVQDKRSRGGKRPAVRKVMYWWDFIGSGSDLSLPDPSPIIGMDQVTAVYYASIAGGGADPGTGDPGTDALVFLLHDNDDNELQIYGYDGVSLAVGDVSDPTIAVPVGLAIDKDDNIWLNPDGDILQYDLDGIKTLTGSDLVANGALMPSNKGDGLIFVGSSDIFYAKDASDGATTVWTSDLGNGVIHAVYQLETSNDLIVGISPGDAQSVKKVSREDGSIILNMGKSGVGARAVAVDEVNGWIYHAYNNIIARVDLSDDGNQIELIIGAGDFYKIVLYGGKVYLCGDQIASNTVWRLDAALAGIEVDYDTGDIAYDMEMKNGILYVVGKTAANEDADTGNVNLLDSDLVKTETCWNIGPNKDIVAIAEKI